MKTDINVSIIGGPTASGKSELAIHFAQERNGIVINGDSMQIYQGLSILTAQPSPEDIKENPHKLYSALEEHETCSVAYWQELALTEIQKAWDLGKHPIVVGGTGLYLQSLVRGLSKIPHIPESTRAEVRTKHQKLGGKSFHAYLEKVDPKMAKRLHENDSQRLMRAAEVMIATGKSLSYWQAKREVSAIQHLKPELIVLLPAREKLRMESRHRLDKMIEQGAVDEVRILREKNLSPTLPIMKALGVHEFSQYLENKLSLEEAKERTIISTHQYIKRQTTWFCNQFPEAQFIGNL